MRSGGRATVRAREVRSKAIAATASGALLAIVLSPIRQSWRSRPKDGFPLSYYPMFTAKRKASGKVTHLVGVTAEGEARNLPHHLAGTGGLNQVRRQLARSARRGTADQVCAAVAAKVVASRERGLADLVEVRVVTGEYRFDDFFAGHRAPIAEDIHARRPVGG